MSFFVSRIRPPPCSTLFPYTTLFRSVGARVALRRNGQVETADGWAGSVSAGVVRPESELRFRPDDTGAHTPRPSVRDRKSTRLNSSHGYISYAVFCLKKKKKKNSNKYWNICIHNDLTYNSY